MRLQKFQELKENESLRFALLNALHFLFYFNSKSSHEDCCYQLVVPFCKEFKYQISNEDQLIANEPTLFK